MTLDTFLLLVLVILVWRIQLQGRRNKLKKPILSYAEILRDHEIKQFKYYVEKARLENAVLCVRGSWVQGHYFVELSTRQLM